MLKRCIDCHFLVVFKPNVGFCMLAKQFLNRDIYMDPFVSCDFFKRCKNNEYLDDDNAEERSE